MNTEVAVFIVLAVIAVVALLIANGSDIAATLMPKPTATPTPKPTATPTPIIGANGNDPYGNGGWTPKFVNGTLIGWEKKNTVVTTGPTPRKLADI